MDAMDQLRVGLARRCGLPDTMADRITGESIEDLHAAAKALAEAHSNQAELAALSMQKPEGDVLLQVLHRDRGAEELSEFTGFDGGVRESAPEPADPYKEHNELIGELVREMPSPAPGVVFFGRPPAKPQEQKPDEGDWRKEGE